MLLVSVNISVNYYFILNSPEVHHHSHERSVKKENEADDAVMDSTTLSTKLSLILYRNK